MAKATITCDGCGKEAPMRFFGVPGAFHKPTHWFMREDKDGSQVACSRECIEKIAKETGKTACVLPV